MTDFPIINGNNGLIPHDHPFFRERVAVDDARSGPGRENVLALLAVLGKTNNKRYSAQIPTHLGKDGKE